jgi:hypothetical protein
MSLFKRTFGHERDAAGKTLDRLVFGCIIVGVAIGLYAGWKAFFIVLAISAIVIFGVPYVFYRVRTRTPNSPAPSAVRRNEPIVPNNIGVKKISDAENHHAMKWSRVAYCVALTASMEILVNYSVSPWLTLPLGAFAAWWSFLCTRTLWSEASFRIAVWRLHQAPSMDDWPAPRKIKQWQWLSDPKLDRLIEVGTVIGVLCFPALLWLPLIFWALK